MAIIWTQPNGQVTVTYCARGINESDHAKNLQSDGIFPSDWTYTIGEPNQNSTFTQQQNRQAIIEQIQALESQATPRLIREVALGNTDSISRLNTINNSIIALRAQL